MTSGPPQSLSPPPLLSDRLDGDYTFETSNNHAHLIDSAAVAAAKLHNQHNVQANSSIDFAFPSTTPAPDLVRPETSSSAAEPISSTTTVFTSSATESASSTSTPSRSSSASYPANQPQFRSHTIAPSPPPQSPAATTPQKPAELTTTDLPPPAQLQSPSSLSAPGLSLSPSQLRSDSSIHPLHHNGFTSTPTRSRPSNLSLSHKTSSSSLKPISRTPSFKTGALANALGSASGVSSTVPSPIITAMGDVTPLPSPLLSTDSPGPWKRLVRPPSREAPMLPPISSESVLVTRSGESVAAAVVNHSRRKSYAALAPGAQADGASGGPRKENGTQVHTRNRSVSEYIPDPMLIPKRMVTVSGPHVKTDGSGGEQGYEQNQMRREPNLSEARGLTPIEKPPTPPPSESSLSTTDLALSAASSKKSGREYFEAHDRHDWKRRRWRAIKMLGQGTFSRVMLATSQISGSDEEEESAANGLPTPEPHPKYDRRTLVAVKVCEHGPRGGASEDRIEMSLKRELEIMQSIRHPSLVHLKAWNIEPTRAILVLSYCPGGDLFDVASAHRDLLSPSLLRRMFAELVGAVCYLHERRIVHRDIKLENVLVNLPPAELCASNVDWTTYPYSVITLTDLGLSRRIADDEKLETRCGSDDYAAPEVIMGQPYDGRATDAWSLGVLLYALLEGRLPFDPLPGGDHATQMRMRSRTSHRIARVEWRWIEYGVREPHQEGDGDHEADPARFEAKGLTGAREVVEGLLKRARNRWPMSKVVESEWVAGGVKVDGGIKFRDEEEGEEVI